MLTHRERVLAAARREKPDRIPLDIWCTDEVRDMLMKHFNVATERELWDCLHLDKIVEVNPIYVGPPEQDIGDETVKVPPWWVRKRRINYGSGTYDEIISSPLTDATTISELEQHLWPSADWYDFSTIEEQCNQWEEYAIISGYTAPFFFHNHVRGLEQSCIDLVAEPEMTQYILDRITEFCWEYCSRLFEAGKGKIHITEVTDDFGSQKDMLISPDSYRKWFKSLQKKFSDLAHQAEIFVFHHDDGAIRRIIPDLIEAGIDILNPIQHVCPGMELNGLKNDFGDKLCFHGGIDNQYVMPRGTVEEVRHEVRQCMEILGRDGGYILAPCHRIQPVTPVENIIALYDTAWNEGWY
ncbi:MAG: uroporphyrinogen decarboxylase family protein [Planctomycetota bacterium]